MIHIDRMTGRKEETVRNSTSHRGYTEGCTSVYPIFHPFFPQ